MGNIIAGVSFLVFSHYLANIVYRGIKAILQRRLRAFCRETRYVKFISVHDKYIFLLIGKVLTRTRRRIFSRPHQPLKKSFKSVFSVFVCISCLYLMSLTTTSEYQSQFETWQKCLHGWWIELGYPQADPRWPEMTIQFCIRIFHLHSYFPFVFVFVFYACNCVFCLYLCCQCVIVFATGQPLMTLDDPSKLRWP